MPAISEIIGRALIDTPIGRAARTATEELKATPKPIPQNVPEAPYVGDPARKPFVRATAAPEPQTVWDWIQGAKTAIGSAFTAEANAPTYIKNLFHTARMKTGEAQAAADAVLDSRVVSQIDAATPKDLRDKGRILSDYVTRHSEYSDLKSKLEQDPSGAHTGLGGATIDQVTADLNASILQIRQHPDLILAHKAFRNVMDEAFAVMKAHGYVTDEQYRTAYTPLQKLDLTTGTLARLRGEDPGGILSATRHRESTGALRETSILRASRKMLADLYEKVAEDELAGHIFNDPTLDRTAQFAPGERLPVGWTRYEPRPGFPGWAGGPEQEALAGGIGGMEASNRAAEGGRVIPEDLAKRLSSFRRARPANETEANIYGAARQWWRWLTVGNPANLGLNIPSDAGTALMGMAGERSNAAGTLQLMPDSYVAALRGAFGHESPEYQRAVSKGITDATFVESVMGDRIPERLAQAAGENQKPQSEYMSLMAKTRRGFEAAPRIAAARAAERRALAGGATPDAAAAEYERVGQAITGDFGAGAPALTRTPLTAFAAPFLRFTGFATERVAKLLTSKGSRARAWTAVIGVPFAAMMWNHQNEEFEKAEYQIPAYDRNALHFLLSENGHPKLDRAGRPIAIRFRYFLPEEVLGMFGLGNLPSRLLEMSQGRKNLGDFANDTASGAIEKVGSQLVPAQIATELATGRNLQTGDEESRWATLRRSIPVAEQVNKVIDAAQDGGPESAITTALSQFSGVKRTGASRADADLLDVSRQLRDLEGKVVSARSKREYGKVKDLMAERERLQNRIRAINAARRGAQ